MIHLDYDDPNGGKFWKLPFFPCKFPFPLPETETVALDMKGWTREETTLLGNSKSLCPRVVRNLFQWLSPAILASCFIPESQ